MDALRSVYYDVEFKADDNPLEKADKTIEELTESFEKMGKTGEKAGKKVEESFDDANKEVGKLGKGAKDTTEKLGGISGNLKGLATGAKGIVAALGIKEITQGAYSLARGFANVEYAAAKINTLAKTDLPVVLEDMRNLALDYGIADATLVGEAMYQALSAGRSYEDLTGGFMDGILKTSKAGFVDPLGAVDLTTTIMNTYGVKDANEIGDVLLATQNRGKTTVAEISQYYSRQLASFNAIGVGYKDAFGMLAEATKTISTADASTGIGAILAEFSKSDTNVNDYFKELNGDTIPDFINKGGSLLDVLKDIRGTLDVTGMSSFDMFGSVEAARTFDALTTSMESLGESIEYVSTSAGELETAFGTMNETSKTELDEMEAAIQDMKTAMGEAIAPYVTDVAKDITSVAKGEGLGGRTQDKYVNQGLNPEYYVGGGIAPQKVSESVFNSKVGTLASLPERMRSIEEMEYAVNTLAYRSTPEQMKQYFGMVSQQQGYYTDQYDRATGDERGRLAAVLDMNQRILDELTLYTSIINPINSMPLQDRVGIYDELEKINTGSTFETSITNHINVSASERALANDIARAIEKSTIAYIPTSTKYGGYVPPTMR